MCMCLVCVLYVCERKKRSTKLSTHFYEFKHHVQNLIIKLNWNNKMEQAKFRLERGKTKKRWKDVSSRFVQKLYYVKTIYNVVRARTWIIYRITFTFHISYNKFRIKNTYTVFSNFCKIVGFLFNQASLAEFSIFSLRSFCN